MKKLKVLKSSLALLLSGTVLLWSFLLSFSPNQGLSFLQQKDAAVKSIGCVEFFALPSVFEEGNSIKSFLNDGLNAGIKNQEFSWTINIIKSIDPFTPYKWVPYHYLKQILFPFHSFW